MVALLLGYAVTAHWWLRALALAAVPALWLLGHWWQETRSELRETWTDGASR